MKSTFLICTHCGKKFISNKDRIPKTPFCSQKCRIIWQQSLRRQQITHGATSRCAKCGDTKPIIEFNSKGKRIQSYCRTCLSTYQMRRWNKKKLLAIEYLGGVCKSCGKGGHPATFTFHHRDNKEFEWAKLKQKSWDKIQKELDKCDLLHGDCHVMLHIKPELWNDL